MVNKVILLSLTSLLLHGCASITGGTSDTMQVMIANCNKTMQCEAVNKKGKYPFTAPGPVTFKKSDDDLNITCKDGDEVISQRVSPVRGSMAWGNILFGGIIGAGVDASSDAHWEMVDSVLIYRENCDEEEA